MLQLTARIWCLAGAVGLMAASGVAAQDSYPDKPIRLVVGFGAGGPTDIPARLIAAKLGTALGPRVVGGKKPAAAGMKAIILMRPGNAPLPANLAFEVHADLTRI